MAEYSIEPWDSQRLDLGFARLIHAWNGEPMIDHMPFLPPIDDEEPAGEDMRRSLEAKALHQKVN